jgi:uncharacterized membrane protein YjjP (DUF1212 family)
MNLEERANLVLRFAQVLQENGESTDQVLVEAERLGGSLGVPTALLPRWGEIQMQSDGFTAVRAANPTGVDMHRVARARCAIDEIGSGRLAPCAAVDAIRAIAKAPPAPTWLFTLAAAAGAAALAVIFGVQHLTSVALIVISAGLGALLRRGVARYSANALLQPFCAALLAGAIGALAVQFNLSTTLRLIAVCPCMILVPGPHLLNSAMDLLAARVHLGASRLIYAGLIILAISAGLLLGLAVLGESLPVDPPGVPVPLGLDVVAAGVAVAAYSVFFSTPLRMLPWPVAVGAVGHALRWVTLTLIGANVVVGVFVASLFVGVMMTPVARRFNLPFAAIGFAAVVSMMPGVYLFRMTSGFVQLASGTDPTFTLLSATIADALTATAIILAMGAGLIVPKLAIDHVANTRKHAPPGIR